MDMEARKKRVLRAIVDDYIRTNAPVGSRSVSRMSGMGVSSATIRNEMADLEEMGYLLQPHVSAGRVPSHKAYRLYVDELLPEGLNAQERDSAQSYFCSRVHDMEDVISLCAQTISEITRCTALVMTPRQSDLRVTTLQLVPVGRASALLIIVTDSGVIRDAAIRVSERLDADALYAISRMLTERLRGSTLRQVQEMLYGYASRQDADARVLSGIAELAGQMEKQTSSERVMVGGAHTILAYPEYADVSRARAFMDVLERKECLLALMRPPEGGVQVRIGAEAGVKELCDCAVLTAPYRVGHDHTGAIGIIGPARMDYARQIETLRLLAERLNDMLSPRV